LKIFKKYNKIFEKHNKNKNKEEEKALEFDCRAPIIMHSYGGSKEITLGLLKLNRLNLFFSLSLKRSAELC